MKNLLVKYLAFFLIVPSSLAIAQDDGVLDASFGPLNNGILHTAASTDSAESLEAVLIQPDGKILIGGYYNVKTLTVINQEAKSYLRRLNADGKDFESNFNNGFPNEINHLSPYSDIRGLALMPNGNIIYAGNRGDKISLPYPAGATIGILYANGTSLLAPNGPLYAGGGISENNFVNGLSYNPASAVVTLGGIRGFVPSKVISHSYDINPTYDGITNKYTPYYNPSFYGNSKALALDDGSSILTFVEPALGGNFSFVKLTSLGAIDNFFGTSGMASRPFTNSSSFLSNPYDIISLPNGSFVACGSTNGKFVLVRINANGTVLTCDSTKFINPRPNATSNTFKSLALQQDNKLIVSGYSLLNGTDYVGVVVRYNENGTLDNSFGTNGSIIIDSMIINASAISTSENGIVVVGQYFRNLAFGKTTLAVAKIKYKPLKQITYNILGKDIVSVESKNTFSINPVDQGNTYVWSYSSSDIYTLGSNTNDSLILFFNKTTPSGILSCSIFDAGGGLLKKVSKNITVNTIPTLWELLEDLDCSPAQTFSSDGYINSFNIRNTKLLSVNTGASLTGYSDLTASSNYDTLYTGNNYQASLECIRTNNEVLYCGIWIDYDNNGNMPNSREFAGTAVSDSKLFTVNNILIPVDAPLGPKRLRVRVRPAKPFTAEEYCMDSAEVSETEDYLMVLDKQDGIESTNFITPNNDGKNDRFIIHGVEANVNNTLSVFNRIGDLVYEETNYDNNWGGTDKAGAPLNPGTYYFVFKQPNPEKSKDDVLKGFFEVRY